MASLSIKLRDPKDMRKSHFQIIMPGIRDSNPCQDSLLFPFGFLTKSWLLHPRAGQLP